MAQFLCHLQTPQSGEGNWSETETDGSGQKEIQIQMGMGLTGNISPVIMG